MNPTPPVTMIVSVIDVLFGVTQIVSELRKSRAFVGIKLLAPASPMRNCEAGQKERRYGCNSDDQQTPRTRLPFRLDGPIDNLSHYSILRLVDNEGNGNVLTYRCAKSTNRDSSRDKANCVGLVRPQRLRWQIPGRCWLKAREFVPTVTTGLRPSGHKVDRQAHCRR